MFNMSCLKLFCVAAIAFSLSAVRGADSKINVVKGPAKAPLGKVASIDLPAGCSFAPRCPHRFGVCEVETPELLARVGEGHLDACLLPVERRQSAREGQLAATAEGQS